MSSPYRSDEDGLIAILYLAAIGAALYVLYIVVKLLLVLFALIGAIVVVCIMVAAAYLGHRLALRGVFRDVKQDRRIARDHYLEAQKTMHLDNETDPKMRERITAYFEHLQMRVYEDQNLFENVVNKLKSVKGLFN
jgi:hypothetical protein